MASGRDSTHSRHSIRHGQTIYTDGYPVMNVLFAPEKRFVRDLHSWPTELIAVARDPFRIVDQL
jgi:hypothetical protein